MIAGCGDGNAERRGKSASTQGTIGLYSSLPIFWHETEELGDLLADDRPPHWLLTALRKRGMVLPLDSLASAQGKLPLRRGDMLVMAQPYPLSPQENVALDDWVRAGGRLLLFADPMLTRGSRYALGDRRRPQDIALLSPILARWGLELRFDEAQPLGERRVALAEGKMPVNLPGRFETLPGARACRFEAAGLLAECQVGKGRVLALADSALLEDARAGEAESRSGTLGRLLDRLER